MFSNCKNYIGVFSGFQFAKNQLSLQNDTIFKMTQIARPLIHGRYIKILQNDANRPTLHLWVLASFCIKNLDEAPIRFASFCKIMMKRPSMRVQTICVILKVECFGRKIYCMITLDNMKSFDVDFIELYWEMKFTGNSWSSITLWMKILRPRKK